MHLIVAWAFSFPCEHLMKVILACFLFVPGCSTFGTSLYCLYRLCWLHWWLSPSYGPPCPSYGIRKGARCGGLRLPPMLLDFFLIWWSECKPNLILLYHFVFDMHDAKNS